MPPTSEGQNIGQDPSLMAGGSGGENIRLLGEGITYSIEAGNPESRLSLPKQTEVLKSVGMDEIEVVAVIGLGQTGKESADFNAWLIRSSEDTYALVNGDAMEKLASSELPIEDLFLEKHSKSIHPGQEIVLGRQHETLGMDLISKGVERYGNADALSRKHATVRLGERKPGSGKQGVEIRDCQSTFGTVVMRGEKEKNASHGLITANQIPKNTPEVVAPELSVAEVGEKLHDIAMRLLEHDKEYANPKYESLLMLRARISRQMADRKEAQANGQGKLSITLQQEIGQTDKAMRADLSYDAFEKLHKENRQLSTEHKRLLKLHGQLIAKM